MDKYAEDGVNIGLGDRFSRLMKEICSSTFEISPFVKVHDFSANNFRGPRGYRFVNLPEGFWETGSADGTGTKTVIVAASGNLLTSSSGLLAMTAMDITRYGGLPLVLFNILDASSLGEDVNSVSYKMFCDAAKGLGELARKHQYVVLDGETAELGVCVGSDNPRAKVKFNWAGVMMGVYHDNKMILGNTLRKGQVVIVFRDNFRDNGMSSVRKALSIGHGYEWYKNPEAVGDIIAAASPSVQYDRMLNEAHGWMNGENNFEPLVDIHLISHLSGGAFKSKLGEDMLKPQGLSVVLDDLFDPSEIMVKCKEWRGMSAEEAYTTWNCGQGALAVVDTCDVDTMLSLAKKHEIEAKVAGVITEKRTSTVSIKSKFDNEWIHYLL
ncbi:AIR synthase-related protein [Patescibacteria group bacterium]